MCCPNSTSVLPKCVARISVGCCPNCCPNCCPKCCPKCCLKGVAQIENSCFVYVKRFFGPQSQGRLRPCFSAWPRPFGQHFSKPRDRARIPSMFSSRVCLPQSRDSPCAQVSTIRPDHLLKPRPFAPVRTDHFAQTICSSLDDASQQMNWLGRSA